MRMTAAVLAAVPALLVARHSTARPSISRVTCSSVIVSRISSCYDLITDRQLKPLPRLPLQQLAAQVPRPLRDGGRGQLRLAAAGPHGARCEQPGGVHTAGSGVSNYCEL